VDAKHIAQAARRLGEAALDPALWPDIMEELSRAAGATGAALMQSDANGPDVPLTRSLGDLAAVYFEGGWHLAGRDPRAVRGLPFALRGEVFTDQDLFTPDEMQSSAYFNDWVYRVGFKWFAGIGFRAADAWWALCLQRTPREGPFEPADKGLLAALAAPLSAAATVSVAMGRAVVTGMTDALGFVGQPALAIDRFGFVLGWNEAADQIFDSEIRISQRRLMLRDRNARGAIERLLDRLRASPDEASFRSAPITVQRSGKPPVVIRALPVSAAARSPFLGARALLTLTELAPQPAAQPFDLTQVFGLTPAEARLAALIATGASPAEAAERLAISRETARTQLKAILSKTDTHRQSALVALLARLGPR
jgi:DNA-binding CsgD family transcriptional regulator